MPARLQAHESTEIPARTPAVVRTGIAARQITVTERETPAPGPDEVLVAVEYCGLCGSDAHIWRADDGYGWVSTGRVLGHEIVGVIASVGEGVEGEWRVGDRVVPIAQTGCGVCDACQRDYANGCAKKRTLGLSRDGGAATHVAVHTSALLRISPELPPLTGVLTEPASVAARAVRRARVERGDRVVVSGPGAVGMLAAVIAQSAGAEVVVLGTELDIEHRSDALGSVGIPLRADLPPSFEPDVWIEAAGARAALENAGAALPVQGRLVIVALYATPPVVQLNVLVRKEIDVITSYSSFRDDYVRALAVLGKYPALGEHLVRAFPLHEIETAFDAVGSGSAIKVAVNPTA